MSNATHHSHDAPPASFAPPEPLPNRFSATQHLFRQTISHSQRRTLCQTLVEAETDLRAYRASINQLKTTIIVLETRRDALEATVAKYRTLLSPIHRMPPEILTHIFSFCCEENLLSKTNPPAVITLSAVCGRWREITLAVPRLWWTISICIGDWYPRSEGSSFGHDLSHLLEIFMERSKEGPLHLEFSEFYHESHIRALEAELNCLLHESNRWRSLTFPGGGCSHLSELPSPFRRLRGRLSTLQHLHLDFGSWNSEESSLIASDFALFSECTSLSSLNIYRGFRLNPEFTYNFPWSQIRSLELLDCQSSHAVQIMALCTNIQEVELSRVNDLLETDPFQAVTLPELRSMSVEGWKDHASSLFQSFTLPSLSFLKIGVCSHSTHWVPDVMATFLLRSSCFITSFSLASATLSDSEIVNLLILMPTLTELSVEECETLYSEDFTLQPRKNKIVTKRFLENLVIDTGYKPRTLLPQLADLSFTAFPLEPDTRRILERALASRLPTIRAFTLIVVVSGVIEQEPDLSDYDSLWCFRDAGVRIHRSFTTSIYW
ncbi:hypothetical protein E1B28_006647 [Marasmius oreades]|uniref:F-box domain-containing protein n=1 Tax=Marasmius oreades TaxID=181124 RepID=A0A9P7UWK9_9AGAR|nr:uncharacterized protein E1B28_006647 [Marasmius oreades]KAG7095962.1 hypothetical protein E1B28_006647 [Marasmius oreades]